MLEQPKTVERAQAANGELSPAKLPSAVGTSQADAVAASQADAGGTSRADAIAASRADAGGASRADAAGVGVGLPPVLAATVVAGETIAMEERIDFATVALQHVQELNARADSKAYLVLTANGFLITFLGWMVSAVQHVWQQPFSIPVGAHMLATAALILTVAVSLNHAFQVMAPRLKQAANLQHGPEHGPHMQPATLLFFVDIVKAHHSDAEYAQALLNATPQELVANLASSIYGSSVSAQEKYRAANASIRALGPVLVAWVVFVGLTFALG